MDHGSASVKNAALDDPARDDRDARAGRAGLRIACLADVHYEPGDLQPRAWHGPWDQAGTLERVRRYAGDARRLDVNLLVVLGDLTHRGDSSSVETVLDALSPFAPLASPKLLVVPGNHDASADGSRHDGWWDRWSGRRTLGSIDVAGRGVWPTDTSTPTVVCSHHPLLTRREAFERAGLRYAGDDPHALQAGRRVVASGTPAVGLCGHLHRSDVTTAGGLLQLACAPVVEAPYEMTLIDVERDRDGRVECARFAWAPDARPNGPSATPTGRWVWSPSNRRWVDVGRA